MTHDPTIPCAVCVVSNTLYYLLYAPMLYVTLTNDSRYFKRQSAALQGTDLSPNYLSISSLEDGDTPLANENPTTPVLGPSERTPLLTGTFPPPCCCGCDGGRSCGLWRASVLVYCSLLLFANTRLWAFVSSSYSLGRGQSPEHTRSCAPRWQHLGPPSKQPPPHGTRGAAATGGGADGSDGKDQCDSARGD